MMQVSDFYDNFAYGKVTYHKFIHTLRKYDESATLYCFYDIDLLENVLEGSIED